MPADLEALVALMPFAGHLGLTLDVASPDRVIARLEWAAAGRPDHPDPGGQGSVT
jgi:hypothetical protein